MAAPGFATFVACCWMEGFGWFEGFATIEEIYRIKSPLSSEWIVIKGMAIGAAVAKSATTSRAGGMRKAPRRNRGHALLVVADF
jgi:hypothetical protein